MIISEKFQAAQEIEMESEVIRIDGEIEEVGEMLSGMRRN